MLSQPPVLFFIKNAHFQKLKIKRNRLNYAIWSSASLLANSLIFLNR
ncbi:hypothetical protein G8J22_01730 [Lentilactobacillus hilgardii]|nr:hypothetical protein G8J22_01730 [Lentilactobacillus hilgardii]